MAFREFRRPSFFGLELTRRGDPSFHDFFNIPYSPLHRIIFPLLHHPGAGADHQRRHQPVAPKLPVGRAWEALREDEIACRSLGINTRNTKLTAFAIGAMFGGFRGELFRHPSGFHFA